MNQLIRLRTLKEVSLIFGIILPPSENCE